MRSCRASLTNSRVVKKCEQISLPAVPSAPLAVGTPLSNSLVGGPPGDTILPESATTRQVTAGFPGVSDEDDIEPYHESGAGVELARGGRTPGDF
jgi:hypothetical protein